MRFTVEDIEQGALKKIRDTAGTHPPPPVLAATLALVQGRADHVIASYESSEDGGTTWRIVASVGRAVVTVDASSPRAAWTLDDSYADEGLGEEEQIDARLRRFDDIAAVQVAEVTKLDTFSEWAFNGQWRLVLRDGDSVDVSAGQRTRTAREACDAFAIHVMKVLAAT